VLEPLSQKAGKTLALQKPSRHSALYQVQTIGERSLRFVLVSGAWFCN
jgi:hypothetical protein